MSISRHIVAVTGQIDIAPCPFCGSTDGAVDRMDRYENIPADADPAAGWWHWYVRCHGCAAEGPPSKSGIQGALHVWGRRVAVMRENEAIVQAHRTP